MIPIAWACDATKDAPSSRDYRLDGQSVMMRGLVDGGLFVSDEMGATCALRADPMVLETARESNELLADVIETMRIAAILEAPEHSDADRKPNPTVGLLFVGADRIRREMAEPLHWAQIRAVRVLYEVDGTMSSKPAILFDHTGRVAWL
jgi:hypothetical protein